MTIKRHYEQFTVFNARIYGMKNLWEPSREYKGQATQKPNYIAGFIVPKTQAHWSQEPVFAGLWQSLAKVHSIGMQGFPYDRVNWPIKDGDVPEPGRTPAEWAKGHWMFGGSSGDPIKTEVVQNGQCVAIHNRAGVKPGDYVAIGGAAAIKANDPSGIKLYVNSILFTAPGEEIAAGNSVSGAELMAQAQAQGLQVAGFGGAAMGGGFGGGAPAGGGFSPGGGNGPAPSPGFNASPNAAPNQFGTGGPAPSFASPSSGAPSFGQQGGAPQGGPGFPVSPAPNAAPAAPGAQGFANSPNGFPPQ